MHLMHLLVLRLDRKNKFQKLERKLNGNSKADNWKFITEASAEEIYFSGQLSNYLEQVHLIRHPGNHK